jgi:hypothetical protein
MTRVPRFGADSSANRTMVKVPLSSDDQRHASVVPGAPGVDDDLIRDHKGRVKADAANQGGGFLARVIGRKLAQEGLGTGAGMVPSPWVKVIAGHADAIVREGRRHWRQD